MRLPERRSIISETCASLDPLVATLTYVIERACAGGVDVSPDRRALRDLLPGLQRLQEAVHEALANDEFDPAFGLGLHASGLAAHAGGEHRLEDMYRPQVNTEALEIVSAWHAAGRHDAQWMAEFAASDDPPADLDPEPQDRPRTADDLLDELIGCKGGDHSMHGTTSCLGIDTVFQVLARSKRTGRLEVRTTEETLTFALIDGEIAFTATDHPRPGQRLGEILVRDGHLTPEHLAELLDAHREAHDERDAAAGDGTDPDPSTQAGAAAGPDADAATDAERPLTPFGARISAQTGLSTDVLAAALTEQARDRFERAQEALAAAFAFYPGPHASDDALRLRVLELLLESSRNQDERHWQDAATGV